MKRRLESAGNEQTAQAHRHRFVVHVGKGGRHSRGLSERLSHRKPRPHAGAPQPGGPLRAVLGAYCGGQRSSRKVLSGDEKPTLPG